MSREKLRKLRDSLHPGQPLDELQWLELVGILDVICEGYDIRKHFAIRPKAGAPPASRGLHKWIVLHFLALCADEPGEDHKVHRGTVAIAWGKPDNEVRKLVGRHRAALLPQVTAIGIESILTSARILSEYRRLTHNPR